MKKTKMGKYIINYLNRQELSYLKKEIFQEQVYHFASDRDNPRIIDAGAHIGLATLYFKQLYPLAQITCFEPIPKSFEALELNVILNGLYDIDCINAALAPQDSTITLHIDPSNDQWYSSASLRERAWNSKQPTTPIQVLAKSLLPWLDEPVDLLKMDIEGAEWHVLPSIKDKLLQVKQLIIEVHPNSKHSPSGLIHLLENYNFRVEMETKSDNLSVIRARRY